MEVQRWARRTISSALLLVATTALGARAAAQDVTPTWTISPTTVSNGTALSASGTGCLDPETGEATGMQAVVQIPRLSYPNVDNPTGIAYLVSGPVAADGSWTAIGGVDTREAFFGPYPDFTTTATAGCLRNGLSVFAYEQTQDIRYEGAATTSSSTAATTTTATPPPSVASGAAAPAPAAPLPTRATYTG